MCLLREVKKIYTYILSLMYLLNWGKNQRLTRSSPVRTDQEETSRLQTLVSSGVEQHLKGMTTRFI